MHVTVPHVFRSTDSGGGMCLQSSGSGAPGNVQGFMREWRKRRHTLTEQYQYVCMLSVA